MLYLHKYKVTTMNNKIFFLLFLHFFSVTFSQTKNDFEFIGGLKLNDKDDQIISYKLVFSENKGIIKGFSVTDLGGEHETKNSIIGNYDKNSKTFYFKEDEIVYTKSSIKKNAFCYVNFSGKLNLANSNPRITDKFSGLYKNGTKCIDGTIQLVGTKKLMKLINKVNTKIQKSKKFDDKVKEKVNPIKMMDSINTNVLRDKQNLQMFTSDSKIKFEINDPSLEDGDMINIFVNKELILKEYVVKNSVKIIDIPINSDVVEIEVEALNEGSKSPNTANVIIKDSKNELKTITKLLTGKRTMITIQKN